MSLIVSYWMKSFERVLPSFLVLAYMNMKRDRQKYKLLLLETLRVI
jgi:hypothetical protein